MNLLLRRLAILAVLLMPLPSRTAQPQDPFAAPNAFAAAYNEWGGLYQGRIATLGASGVTVQEQRAFSRLVDRFNDLRKYAKSQYE